MQYSARYIFLFTSAVCLFFSVLISISVVSLRDRQEANRVLDRQKNVLLACGQLQPGEKATVALAAERFQQISPKVIDLKTGDPVPGADPAAFQVSAVMKPAGTNIIQMPLLPTQMLVYEVLKEGRLDCVVLPIVGKGLQSTLNGYIALEADGITVRGITFHEHGETPGLGGEVDNPRWKSLWKGRKAYDAKGGIQLRVIKGVAGSADKDPHRVDGLSGATFTSNGVSAIVQYWLGPAGYMPYLHKRCATGGVS